MPTDRALRATFRDFLERAIAAGPDSPVRYDLDVPKWQFLSYAADRGGVVLHGSGDPDIAAFEPRRAHDVNEFGDQAAIYAACDGIWPIFFAIVDRPRYHGTLVNACLRVEGTEERGYFFSLNQTVLDAGPWRDGTVYLLPADGFRSDELIERGGLLLRPAQVARSTPVVPIAKLAVTPGDFPFLSNVRGHDEAMIGARCEADPDGFPWLEDERPAAHTRVIRWRSGR